MKEKEDIDMYERMLDKEKKPTLTEMEDYCGKSGEYFTLLNAWLEKEYKTISKQVFPYGKSYGWAIEHRKKKKLMCHVFAEKEAFSVMMRLTNEQFAFIYDSLRPYSQDYIDHKYPCSEGGWIHYRVTCGEHFEDIKKLLALKFEDEMKSS